MKRLPTLVLGLGAVVGPAWGDLFSTTLKPVANGLGPGTATYDLTITVPQGNDWTSTAMVATLSGATFYQHPGGGNTQPDPLLLNLFPTLAWDTFMTCPDGWPNTAGVGITPGFAGTPLFGATKIDATWFDIPPNGGGGTWTIARFSLQDLGASWRMTVAGSHTKTKGGNLVPFLLRIPEPAAAILLLLALPLALKHPRHEGGDR